MNVLEYVTKFVKGDDTILHVFPTTMFVSKYPDPYDEEFEYIEKLPFRQEGSYNGNCKTEDSYILEHKELSKIKTWIKEKIKKYAKDVISTETDLIITNSWANRNEPGAGHPTHHHQNSIISGIFYLNVTSSMPPTQFYNRYLPMIQLQRFTHNSMNAEYVDAPMTNGDLIMFPSDIMHSVNINQQNDIRYTLSFNTFAKELGNDRQLSYVNWEKHVNE